MEMSDRYRLDKTIHGLEICSTAMESPRCYECPYKHLKGYCMIAVMSDALALLKAQCKDEQREYEAAVEMTEYCESYESAYSAEDGSM